MIPGAKIIPQDNIIRDYGNSGRKEKPNVVDKVVVDEPWVWWPYEKFLRWLEERERELGIVRE